MTSLPRWDASVHLGVRWPVGFGLDPLVRRSDKFGWCYAYDLVIGPLVVGVTVFGNPASWFKKGK